MPLPPNLIEQAERQLIADYDAAFSQFCRGIPGDDTVSPYRMFCLGVTMCTLSLKGFAEDSKTWPLGADDVEQAVEAYYEAARRTIHAD